MAEAQARPEALPETLAGVSSAHAPAQPGTAEPGTWKRAFDVVFGALFLLVASPLFALIAIAIKLETPGPVFFRQRRVGRGGREFRMLKFRKMPENLPTQGPMLTRMGDPRLTRVGRWLERMKFDELPQLWDVLRGEMSLIGPRPEVPKFVDLADPIWWKVLSVRPGIFGANQILARNEAELYPDGCEDIEGFYRQHILPEKLRVDAGYVEQAGLWNDLRLLFSGVMVAAFGTVTGSAVRGHALHVAILGIDIAASAFSLAFAFYLHYHGTSNPLEIPAVRPVLVLTAVCRTACFLALGIYRRRLSVLTYSDMMRTVRSVVYGSGLMLIMSSLIGMALPRTVLLFDALLLTGLLLGKAYGIHEVLYAHRGSAEQLASRPVVVGVGLATLFNLASFLTMLRWWEYLEVSRAGAAQLLGVLAGFTVVRAYGFLRVFPQPVTGWRDALRQTPRIVRNVGAGSLFVYLGDTLIYSQIITLPVLLGDLLVSVTLALLLARTVSPRLRVAGVVPVREAPKPARVLIIGIAPETEFYLCYLDSLPPPRPELLGILDASPSGVRAQRINNVPVIGRITHLRALLEAHRIDSVVYFPQALSAAQEQEVVVACRRYELSVRPFPELAPLVHTERASRAAAV